MNKNFLVLMSVVSLAILASAVMYRHSTTAMNPYGYYTKTDRWTGQVTVCRWSKCDQD